MKLSTQAVAAPIEIPDEVERGSESLELRDALHAESIERLLRLWEKRRFLRKATLWGLAVSTIIAFLIPKRYESTTRLMPPDPQTGSSVAMLSALAASLGDYPLDTRTDREYIDDQ